MAKFHNPMFSDLELNPNQLDRKRGKRSGWEQKLIPSTRKKRIQRFIAVVFFAAAVGLLVFAGNFFYDTLLYYYPR